LSQVGPKPTHEKLPWPGLKAKDHLTRVVTQAVKETKETRERNEWAEKHITLVLDHISPEVATRLFLREMFARHDDLLYKIDGIEDYFRITFSDIFGLLRQALDPPIPPKHRIGFIA